MATYRGNTLDGTAGVAAMKWRHRDTAPKKDGVNFIAYDPRCGLLFTMHWDAEDDKYMTEDELWSGYFSHWTPLPKPPKDED